MTNPPGTASTQQHQRLFTFRSGGWVIVLALLASAALMAWAVTPAILKHRPPGDGRNVESYGFDLSTLLIPVSEMATPMLYRDMPPRMDHPQVLTASQARAINEEQRGKYLVSSDRVVGVVVNGEARAYPISLLTVHEIINDTLGGREIAVTYSWPGDAVRVFDRAVGDETLLFGTSGLLYNANLLMYDRREDDPSIDYPDRGESLWSQLQARAVSGPAAEAGLRLTTIPAQLVSWAHWQELEPQTTVIARDPMLIKRYNRAGPDQYFNSADVPFPVKPLPTVGPGLKDRVVVVTVGQEQKVYPLSEIAARAAETPAPDGRTQWEDELGGEPITFIRDHAAGTVAVIAGDEVDLAHSFWFAWHAMFPDSPLAE